MTLSRRAKFALLAGLFMVAFVLRAYQPVSRPAQWYRRSEAFGWAISTQTWEATYQSRHPGFTGMVIGGAALAVYERVKDTPASLLFEWAAPPGATAAGRGMAAGVMGLALVIAALIATNTYLLSKLSDWLTALTAGGLMAFSPFYLAHSRVFHLDALAASLMLLSGLLILLYVQHEQRRYLILSGLVGGLAILTKVPALFTLPFMGLALLVDVILRLRAGWAAHPQGRLRWIATEAWRHLVAPALIWLAVSLLPWACWPAMWVRPLGVLQEMFAGTLQHVERSHVGTRFFAGIVYWRQRPSPLFYPATLVYNTTFLSLTLGTVAVGHYLLWPRRAELPVRPRTFWLLVAFTFFFVLQMAIGAKEVDRYILPAHVMLDVVAAVGLSGLANLIGRALPSQARLSTAIPPALAVITVGLQAAVALPYAPNYGAHHNHLLGGNPAAVNMIEIMGQNEGVNYVGEYLNQQGDPASTTVGAAWPLNESLPQYYAGQVERTILVPADYYVFNIAAFQRQYDVGDWREPWVNDYQYREPQLVVELGGVNYVWVYATHPQDRHPTITIRRGPTWFIPLSRVWAALLAAVIGWALRVDRAILALVPPARLARARLRSWEWAASTGALLIGAALRTARLTDAPPGIIHDEVLNWLNAQMALAGRLQAIYPFGGGREAFFVGWEAASSWLLGSNVVGARLPSLLFGMLGIAAAFALARRLFGQPAGVVAAVGWSVSFWALMFSRLATHLITLPVMGSITAYLFLRLMQSRRRRWGLAILAGLALGAMLYTHFAALVLVAALALWLALVAAARPGWLRGKGLMVGASLALAAALAIPLVRAWADPSSSGRAGGPLTTLWAGSPAPSVENIGAVLGVFTVQGDSGLEFNQENQPLLPTPVIALLFYLGLAWAAVGVFKPSDDRWPGYALLLVWLLGMLVPALVTDRPLHPTRTIGLLGVVYLFPALAAAALLQIARQAGGARWAITVGLLVALGAALELQHTASGYFDSWARNPVVAFLYQSEFRRLGADLDADRERLPLAVGGLTPFEMDPASLRLLMRDDARAQSAGYFDPQTALLLPPPDERGRVVLAVPASIPLHPALAQQLASWGAQTGGDGEAYTLYIVPLDRVHPPALPTGERRFYPADGSAGGPLIALVGLEPVGAASPGQSFSLLTTWIAAQANPGPLRIFVHLTDSGGNILTQSDVLGVPAQQWRAGDIIVQAHDLALAPDAPLGPYRLSIGLYDPRTGSRLSVSQPPGGDHAAVPLESR